MKYERLTPKDKKFHWTLQNHEYINKLFDRLAELEDKIESGLFVELPCKVGDIVYVLFDPFFVGDIFKMVVRAILIERNHILVKGRNEENYETYSIMSDYIFPTKEAAEAKLKELENK